MPTRNNEAKVWKQRRTVSKKIATYKNTDINSRFACHIWPSCQSKEEATNGSNPHLKGVVVYDRLLAGPRGAIDDEVFSTSFHLPVFILALPNVSLKFRRMKFKQFVGKNYSISFSIQKKDNKILKLLSCLHFVTVLVEERVVVKILQLLILPSIELFDPVPRVATATF